eukprot:TRINITY_DN39232_c0_g1_i1.p1 TRINITY_DN39232_c0_g1~~TRINITY_DN39232_c0_g1_i1.p1  ORF type:complete len:119 (-),score=21.18 TRINITY_DN39232_c0_g1_i1:85-417(-)
MDDPFIRNYIEDLLKNIRTQVLLELLKPYTRVRIPYIAEELNIANDEEEVQRLLVSLILDYKIDGHIDQVNKLVVLNRRTGGSDTGKYQSFQKWMKSLDTVHSNVVSKIT